MVKILIMSFLLNGEPVILNNLPDYSTELESTKMRLLDGLNKMGMTILLRTK